MEFNLKWKFKTDQSQLVHAAGALLPCGGKNLSNKLKVLVPQWYFLGNQHFTRFLVYLG